MALNYYAMFAQLKMGVDVETETPASAVPHVMQPGYVPRYTVRNDTGQVVLSDMDVYRLVDEVHGSPEALTLYEDDHPVFTVY
jgi:hypothetical protein